MEKIRSIAKKYPYLLTIAVVLLVCIAGYFVWRSHQTQPVTTESQVQAETPAGVTQAADEAQVSISPSQAQEAASQIRHIYTNSIIPQYTITTTGANAEKQAQAAQKAAGADFSVITNKSDTTKHTSLKTLPTSSTVELNQYNVQAYKKVLHTVDVGTSDAKSVGEVGYTVSKKISKDGKYIGVGASYNFDNEKAMVKLSYTW